MDASAKMAYLVNILEKRWLQTKQFVYRPMLLTALALHGLLLVIPIPESSPPPSPPPSPSPTPSPAKKISLTSLLAKKPVAKSVKKVSSKPKVKLKRAEVPPPDGPPIIQPTPQDSPSPQPSPENSTSSSPGSSPSPQESPDADSSPDPSPSPSSSPETGGETFDLSSLTSSNSSEDENVEEVGIDYLLMPEPEVFVTKESLETWENDPNQEPTKQPGVSKIRWFPLTKPDAVLEQIQAAASSEKLDLLEQGDYGGGMLYHLKKQDQVISCLCIMRTRDRTGVFLVVMDRDPNQPDPTGDRK